MKISNKNKFFEDDDFRYFTTVKNDIISQLNSYINSSSLRNFFSNHHHNDRAKNTLYYIDNCPSISNIEEILINEKKLFEGNQRNIWQNYYYTTTQQNVYLSSKYAVNLKNKNRENSTYYNTILRCISIVENVDNLYKLRQLGGLNVDSQYNDKTVRETENFYKGIMKSRHRINSFVLQDEIKDIFLEYNQIYIYVIILNENNEYKMRITKRSPPILDYENTLTRRELNYHSLIAYNDEYNSDNFIKNGISDEIKVLMAGELKCINDSTVIVNNSSGHFKPSHQRLELLKDFLKKKLPGYKVEIELF
ncbi:MULTISPECIES: hypothetical protein [unclassified Francisella]|uniref:hypothetical protein n=1 Tax=unclassified Francisella TaxID=2610885 RepID=UPI002E33FE25|nr:MULTISPECIES: hypothetical protein [unclassified Francisella]MED7818450.1 hypothetical protein [Francisella sp. 19S2-4]MED7829295.1 hypothetical protein [Francisella sp. 19S2-10]